MCDLEAFSKNATRCFVMIHFILTYYKSESALKTHRDFEMKFKARSMIKGIFHHKCPVLGNGQKNPGEREHF